MQLVIYCDIEPFDNLCYRYWEIISLEIRRWEATVQAVMLEFLQIELVKWAAVHDAYMQVQEICLLRSQH